MGGRADQAETWQQAAALLRSLHENQGVNAVLLPCGPAAALALNEELAQGTPPAALADNAASEEEAAFWEWLAAYNAGMGNVSEWLQSGDYSLDGETLHTIPYPETDAYVRKVQRAYQIYEKLYS